ncbi:MAG TPA: hypothetical protein VHY22_18275 [Chthoniobacteraceae bacterium]|nr:hypothetical protein [Chthoniobacteraceae bacterium]
MTITLKNVPVEVHAALKRQARLHKRSLNQEAILCLDLALDRGERNPREMLADIRRLRSALPKVSQEFVEKAIKQGRQ